MSEFCCVLGPPEWFEALTSLPDPAGPDFCLIASLDDPLLRQRHADVVVVRRPPGAPPRVTRDVLRRLAHAEFGDPLRLVAVAESDEIDRVVAFELGADDFVADPVSFREIRLRVRALLRRHRPPARLRTRDTFGRLVIDGEAHDVTIDGTPRGLTLAEFHVVDALIAEPGVVVTREALLLAARGSSAGAGLRSVDTHIKRIRRKLGVPDLVQTIRGVGYRLVSPK